MKAACPYGLDGTCHHNKRLLTTLLGRRGLSTLTEGTAGRGRGGRWDWCAGGPGISRTQSARAGNGKKSKAPGDLLHTGPLIKGIRGFSETLEGASRCPQVCILNQALTRAVLK